MASMSILRWLKKENAKGLPDRDKKKSMEMKSVAAAVNNAVQPAQSTVSKKPLWQCTILTETGNKLLHEINWKIHAIKMHFPAKKIAKLRYSKN